MQRGGWRRTYHFAHETLETGASCEMPARDFLCVAFAWAMGCRLQMMRIRSPLIRKEPRAPQGPGNAYSLDQRAHDVPFTTQTRLNFDVILPLWGRRGPR